MKGVRGHRMSQIFCLVSCRGVGCESTQKFPEHSSYRNVSYRIIQKCPVLCTEKCPVLLKKPPPLCFSPPSIRRRGGTVTNKKKRTQRFWQMPRHGHAMKTSRVTPTITPRGFAAESVVLTQVRWRRSLLGLF